MRCFDDASGDADVVDVPELDAPFVEPVALSAEEMS